MAAYSGRTAPCTPARSESGPASPLHRPQFADNAKAGEGTLFYSNGDVFSGQWTEEGKSGLGKYKFAKVRGLGGGRGPLQGGEYSGGFQKGRKEGEGRYSMPVTREDEDTQELVEVFEVGVSQVWEDDMACREAMREDRRRLVSTTCTLGMCTQVNN